MSGELGKGTEPRRQIRGSSLRFLPPSPLRGFPSQSLQLTLKKKKKALKESYRQLQKKNTPTNTHTKSKPFSHLPAHLPPTQEFPVSLRLSFVCHLSVWGARVDCGWVGAGTQRAEPVFGRREAGAAGPTTPSIQTPVSRPPGLPPEEGSESRWSPQWGPQHLWPFYLPTPVPSPAEKDSLILGQKPLSREGWTLSVSDAETWSGPWRQQPSPPPTPQNSLCWHSACPGSH